MKNKKFTVKDAASMLGVTEVTMRYILEDLPSNVCTCIRHKNRRTFYINKDNFKKYYQL